MKRFLLQEKAYKILSVEQLISFDRAVMVYKIINKLCPENLWSKFNLRFHYS